MKKTNWTHILICSFIVFSYVHKLHAQDPHFSQHFNSPVYQNPAASGSFPGSMRLQLNYRSQWNAVTVPFQTMFAALDMMPGRRTYKKNRFGIGITMLRDKAGDSEYGIFELGLNLAYHRTLNRRGTHVISLGMITSFAQRSINYMALRFPGQFDGTTYNQGIPNGETFPQNNLSYPNIGAGLQWNLNKHKIKYQFGLSLNHLNKPGLSFLENSNVRLEPKLNIETQISFPLQDFWEMIPSFQYEIQDNYKKFVLGSLFRYSNPFKGTDGTTFYGGIFTRWNDAMIFATGLEYDIYNFCISYDINYSTLKTASHYQGGIEVSLSFMLHNKAKKLKRDISCPVF